MRRLLPGPEPEAGPTARPREPHPGLSDLGEGPLAESVHETDPAGAGAKRPRSVPDRGQIRPPLPEGPNALEAPLNRFPEPFRDPAQLQEQTEIMKLAESNPQAAGTLYENLVAGDFPGGRDVQGKFTRPGRIMDIGTEHEVTIEGRAQGFGKGKLDQLWDDIADNGHAIVTVPKLSPTAAGELSRLLAQARERLNPGAIIVVRETLP